MWMSWENKMEGCLPVASREKAILNGLAMLEPLVYLNC